MNLRWTQALPLACALLSLSVASSDAAASGPVSVLPSRLALFQPPLPCFGDAVARRGCIGEPDFSPPKPPPPPSWLAPGKRAIRRPAALWEAPPELSFRPLDLTFNQRIGTWLRDPRLGSHSEAEDGVASAHSTIRPSAFALQTERALVSLARQAVGDDSVPAEGSEPPDVQMNLGVADLAALSRARERGTAAEIDPPAPPLEDAVVVPDVFAGIGLAWGAVALYGGFGTVDAGGGVKLHAHPRIWPPGLIVSGELP